MRVLAVCFLTATSNFNSEEKRTQKQAHDERQAAVDRMRP